MIDMRGRWKTATRATSVRVMRFRLRYNKRSYVIDEKVTEKIVWLGIMFTNVINRYRTHRGMLPVINSQMIEDRDPWHIR